MVTTGTRRPVRRRAVVRSMVPTTSRQPTSAAVTEPAITAGPRRRSRRPEPARRPREGETHRPDPAASRPSPGRCSSSWSPPWSAGGLLGRRWYDQRQLAQASAEALAAARQTCVNFVSISASTVDADLKRISDGATGEFKDEFTQDTAQVKAAVVQNKVDSHGTVLRAGIVSADKHSAVVLVAVDATVKNTSAPDGRLSHYRIQVNMARDAASGRWLVAQLQFVG